MRRLFQNIDTNDIGDKFLNRLVAKETCITEDLLYPFVDQYAGNGVTDLLICLTCQYSIPESRVLTDSFAKYEQTMENGLPVNYQEMFAGIYTVYKKYGIDPIQVWLERCRMVGLTPWITFRMNDCHCPEDDTCCLRPELFYEAKQKGWMIGERYGYYKNCLNFAVPEIREVWLRLFDEQLGKYDTDGIELDFMREIRCFDYVNEPNCREIMNGFMREVKAVVKTHEKAKGHPIAIGVRLMRDPEQCKIYGFDPETWDREGLVDMITVCPRWQTCDSDMPIAAWKKQLPNTRIYAGVETLVTCGEKSCYTTPEVVRGYANRYLSEGADGMYLYNYYTVPESISEEEQRYYERCQTVFETCGGEGLPMRYIVTKQDVIPEGCIGYEPLPMEMTDEGVSFELYAGNLRPDVTAELIVGYKDAEPEQVKLYCNGTVVEGSRTESSPAFGALVPEEGCDVCTYVPDGSTTWGYAVPISESGRYSLCFRGKGTVTYLELTVK